MLACNKTGPPWHVWHAQVSRLSPSWEDCLFVQSINTFSWEREKKQIKRCVTWLWSLEWRSDYEWQKWSGVWRSPCCLMHGARLDEMVCVSTPQISFLSAGCAVLMADFIGGANVLSRITRHGGSMQKKEWELWGSLWILSLKGQLDSSSHWNGKIAHEFVYLLQLTTKGAHIQFCWFLLIFMRLGMLA